MSLPLILQPGEGRTVQFHTSTCTFKATGKETHGHFISYGTDSDQSLNPLSNPS